MRAEKLGFDREGHTYFWLCTGIIFLALYTTAFLLFTGCLGWNC